MRILCCFFALGLMAGPASAFAATPTDGVAPMKSEWFTASEVAPATWRIVDHGTVNVYLVIGRDRALLIDTGYGQANLRQYVQSLTSLPLTVINTHGHLDHSGADLQFGTVLADPADFAGIERTADSVRRESKPDPKLPAAERFDYGANARPLALKPVKDGEIIDLGGRQLEVITTPGHTPGEIVLLDRAQKLLFAGDHINRLVWLQLRNCLPLEAYLASLEKIAARADEFTTIMPGHNEPFDRGVLAEKITCVKGILAGTIADEAYPHAFASGRVAKFERSSVVFDPQNLQARQ
ncbi:MBL fold metallo-hydrolase [Opitutus terrae]|nr:MBL fold metallo-hydrolase [Opitutus terrae]